MPARDAGPLFRASNKMRTLALAFRSTPAPLVGDDCMDAGGRATQGAVAEGLGEGALRHFVGRS